MAVFINFRDFKIFDNKITNLTTYIDIELLLMIIASAYQVNNIIDKRYVSYIRNKST